MHKSSNCFKSWYKFFLIISHNSTSNRPQQLRNKACTQTTQMGQLYPYFRYYCETNHRVLDNNSIFHNRKIIILLSSIRYFVRYRANPAHKEALSFRTCPNHHSNKALSLMNNCNHTIRTWYKFNYNI